MGVCDPLPPVPQKIDGCPTPASAPLVGLVPEPSRTPRRLMGGSFSLYRQRKSTPRSFLFWLIVLCIRDLTLSTPTTPLPPSHQDRDGE